MQLNMINLGSNSGLISAPLDGFYDFDSIQFPLFDQSVNSFATPIQPNPDNVNKNKMISFQCKVTLIERTACYCGEFMAERLRRYYHLKKVKYMHENFL